MSDMAEKPIYKKIIFWLIMTVLLLLLLVASWFILSPSQIRITHLVDGKDFGNIFDNVETMTVLQEDAQYIVSYEDDVNLILEKLKGIEIESAHLKEEKYHDYTAYNHIPLNEANLCFTDDFSKLWINYHDDVTYYYSITNPDIAKAAFDIAKDGKKTDYEICNVEVGCDRSDIEVKVKKIDILSSKPEIEIEIKNTGNTEYSYGEGYGVKRIIGDTGVSWEDEISCSTRGHAFNAVAHILKPTGSTTEKYILNGYDFSKTGRYKFELNGMYIYFEIK